MIGRYSLGIELPGTLETLTNEPSSTTRTLYTTYTPNNNQDNQYLSTITSAGTVYVVVESGAANANNQVQVVQGGAESLLGGDGLGKTMFAVFGGVAVVGVVMFLL